jgi:hypothetical protein
VIDDELAARWSLERGLVFLNHGSFGAGPTEVHYERLAEARRKELAR